MQNEQNGRSQQAFNALLLVIVVGIIGVLFYTVKLCPYSCEHWARNLSIGLLVAGASLAVGGFFGFLFGMPRDAGSATAPPAPGAADPSKQSGNLGRTGQEPNTKPNTNLEEISDWLTKILVGAGLTQLGKLPHQLGLASDYIAKGMNNVDSDKAFASATIIFFGICGFLAVFLWARLYMAKLLGPELAELRATDEKQQKDIEDVKNLALAPALEAMEDVFGPDQTRSKTQKAQIAIAADIVNRQDPSVFVARDWMILAYKYFQERDYKSATEKAEAALKANPPQEMLWQIYNSLGLCYHWQQPPDWKPGGDNDWFDNATKNYELAIKATNSPNQALLSKANECFVYLDAQRYADCERISAEVISREADGGQQISEICDLARIAAAAAKVMQGDSAGAEKCLNDTKAITSLEYLFNTDDLPADAIKRFAGLAGLGSDIQAFIIRIAKMLKLIS